MNSGPTCIMYEPNRKISMFGAIFKVNSIIGKLWDLLGHFDENDVVDF